MRLLSALLVIAAGCAPPTPVVAPATLRDSAMYVVRLGRDTSYYQWVIRNGHDVRMTVVERIPRVRVVHTQLRQRPDGAVQSLHRTTYFPGDADTNTVDATVSVAGDSTITELGPPGSPRRFASHGTSPVVAALLMTSFPVLAPYAPRAVGDTVRAIQMAGALGDRPLIIARVARDTFTLQSTIMGRIRIHVDGAGRSHGFNALASSLNLEGERRPWLPIDSVIRRLVTAERVAGRAGGMSPRDTARATIGGAAVTVDYSRPSMRGRRIFGGIVPWNVVWRTGANRATHLSTNRPLLLGGRELAAGTYTLFTLPSPSGWTLIVSSQTGQWGTDYDASRDVMRVPMQVEALAEPVEQFTILVEPSDSGGMLRFRWENMESRVGFVVR